MNQIVLVDHKKAELWLPPGGHVDSGEDPKETVRREAKEELSIEAEFFSDNLLFLTVTQTVGNIAKNKDVSLWYLLKGDPSQSFDYDINEFNQIHWFSSDGIPFQRSDLYMKRFLQKMSQGNLFSTQRTKAFSINFIMLFQNKLFPPFVKLKGKLFSNFYDFLQK